MAAEKPVLLEALVAALVQMEAPHAECIQFQNGKTRLMSENSQQGLLFLQKFVGDDPSQVLAPPLDAPDDDDDLFIDFNCTVDRFLEAACVALQLRRSPGHLYSLSYFPHPDGTIKVLYTRGSPEDDPFNGGEEVFEDVA